MGELVGPLVHQFQKGDVIYEQKYIGIGRQFRVFMPIITKYKVNYLAIK